MKYPQEKYARELHQKLMQQLANPITTISIEGAGVHWECTLHRGGNSCITHCFDSKGAEYLSVFKRNSQAIAWGRTASESETLRAIDFWLQGQELAEVSARVPFIDQSKRVLLEMQADIVKRFPQLTSVEGRIQHDTCDLYSLHFSNGERTCVISFYGKNEFPDAIFHWDECEMFRFNANKPEDLAAVVNRWVGEQMLPSQLRAEFPWLDIGKLADAYECGHRVEGEFLQSWDYMEHFYDDMKYEFAPDIRQFIAQMRAAGYDKTLRAGQSMWTLMLSRSRRHGLGNSQSFIGFDFHPKGMNISTDLDFVQKTYPIDLTPEVDVLLKQLEAQDIN